MKKIQDYLHLYLMCKCRLHPWENDWVVTSIGYSFSEISSEDGEVTNNVLTKEIKPILRPLSDMTDDEKKELWELIFRERFHKNGKILFFEKRTTSAEPRWVLCSGLERLGIELNGTVWAYIVLSHHKYNQHEVTRYLLSKGFDLFDLIPSGLAIDKTKIAVNGPNEPQ